ncbi:sigma-54-dependent Fis family transcriptional regulator [Nitrospinae bacterium]|nr:sigma-54-dependent Fis family transcriptional regulator [Nitrospinota bacterium]
MKRIVKETNIQVLRKISDLFTSTSLKVDELLAMVMDAAKDIVGVKNGSLLLVQDEKTYKLQFYQASGKNMGQLKDIDLPPGVGISGFVAKTGEAVISDDVAKDPRWYGSVSEKLKLPIQSMASFPLVIDKKVIGVVQFLDKADGSTFNKTDINILKRFASLMAKFFQLSKTRHMLGEEFGRLKEHYQHRYTIVGESEPIRKCIIMAEKVAQSKATVLLNGESGTGKELFAHLIHDRSQRQNKPFLSVSCGALPASILERELFGHEKGAFTGADTKKIGLFEAANTGTLFLDEIGELPLDMQVKLLRVIQEESFMRLGGTETINVDVRLITATNRDLEKEILERKFRQDLFYRINVIKITLPPLRDKLGDIGDLLTYFLKKHSQEGQPVKKPGKGLVSHLMSYSWPGNIRELENSVERAIVLTDEEELPPEAFPFETSQAPIEFNVGSPLKEASDSFRTTFISNTLKSTGGNRTKAAQILGVQRSYLSRLLKELGIK